MRVYRVDESEDRVIFPGGYDGPWVMYNSRSGRLLEVDTAGAILTSVEEFVPRLKMDRLQEHLVEELQLLGLEVELVD